MSQSTNIRQTSNIGDSSGHTASDTLDVWGQWAGQKYYDLVVMQHPIRARMCGFGDKDRRPLAPAAVAKMIVRRADNSPVDVDEVDCSFFLVSVDLWSADGQHEMNLVLHPSSSERYVTTNTPKPRRRVTNTNSPLQRTTQQAPSNTITEQSASNQTLRPPADAQSNAVPSGMAASATYGAQPFTYSQQSTSSISEAVMYPPNTPYSQPVSNPSSNWSYPPQGASDERSASFTQADLPSNQSYARNNPPAIPNPMVTGAPSNVEMWQQPESALRDHPEASPYRTWQHEGPYPAPSNTTAQSTFSSTSVEPSMRGAPQSQINAQTDAGEAVPWPQHTTSSAPEMNTTYTQDPYNPHYDNTMYSAPPYAHPPTPYYVGSYAPNMQSNLPPPQMPSLPPLPRHTYTRTLVGPLVSNACRLLDENKKPGIFFLFQDLSVRTEGSFRLRLRLFNVGAPPAPEPGAPRVHTDVSSVLAQTFTDPFIVFSAKRFPGVPDTTPLSIALGNQGQKLPLRNRHGSSKHGRRRQHGDSNASDDESDDV